MADRITAKEARDRVAKIRKDEIDIEQNALLPAVYGLIRESVENKHTSLDLEEVLSMYPRADFKPVKKVLVEEDEFTITGRVLSW